MKSLHSSPHPNEAALDHRPSLSTHRSPRREELKKFIMNAPRMSIAGSFQSATPDYVAKAFQRVPSQSNNALRLSRVSRSKAPVGGALKRSVDFSIALAAIIVMAPMMLTLAALILITMGRPIVFMQQRVGFNRSTFHCFKFRSMVVDAQEKLARHLAEDEEAARLWQDTQKLKKDPRITWLGHLLRKSSLDELPQLFNILRGDMSCIGPRPVLASELHRYGPHAEDYAKAKPGLTGFWQVSGRSNTTYAHRVNCDRYYVRRWSPVLDAMILLRTIPAVLRFKETG